MIFFIKFTIISKYYNSKYSFQGQFCMAFLHSFQLLFYDCDYPKWSLIFILPNAIFFYFLFSEFYNKAYTPAVTAKGKKDDDQDKSAAKLTNGKASNGAIQNGKVSNGYARNGSSVSNGKVQNGKAKVA